MATRIPEGSYVTVSQYARQAQIKVQSVYQAIHKGRLKAYHIDTTWLIPAEAMIQDKRIKSGKYIGVSEFRKTLDVEELARKRGLL